jgi:hypothetical protein
VLAVAYMKLVKNNRTEKVAFEPKQSITAVPPADNTAIVLPSIEIARMKGPRGQVIQFYTQALSTIQASTGTQLTANMTLHEYAQATQIKIGGLDKEFKELTKLTEKALYSPHEPDFSEIKQAENIVQAIRRNQNADT